jgi:hypothetical protein
MAFILVQHWNIGCFDLIGGAKCLCAEFAASMDTFLYRGKQAMRSVILNCRCGRSLCASSVKHNSHIVSILMKLFGSLKCIDNAPKPFMGISTGKDDDCYLQGVSILSRACGSPATRLKQMTCRESRDPYKGVPERHCCVG